MISSLAIMISPPALPLLAVVSTFLFVLLIILLTAAPRVGKWVVGATILVPLLAFAVKGFPSHVPVLPLIAILSSFGFVLLIILFHHSRGLGIALIVAIVSVVLLSLVGVLPVASHHRQVYEQTIVGLGGSIQIKQQTQHNAGTAVVNGDFDRVCEDFLQVPSGPVLPSPSVPVGPPTGDELSPIWSEGVENEYEADIYPSKLAAARALGRRMCRPLARVIADMNTATEIVLFQDENDGALAGPFKEVLARALPDVPCSVLFGSRNLDANEIGITLRSHYGQDRNQTQSELLASARHRDWEATVRQSFIDKPWMEDFSSFASSQPLEQFVVARSWETCTSPVEARNQALQDAAAQLQQRIGKKWIIPGVEEALTVGPREVEEGGFVADLFLQSFDGVSGRFWRHAMLINASPEKLKWLDTRMSRMAHSARMSWARMILSALGVLVVIIASYLFLNMATRGYYVWSLRIAGTVLAIAGIVSIILVLR